MKVEVRGHTPGTTLQEKLTYIDRCIDENSFIIHRGADEYSRLGYDFVKYIYSLPASARWLDAGAGLANAMLEFARGYWIEDTDTPPTKHPIFPSGGYWTDRGGMPVFASFFPPGVSFTESEAHPVRLRNFTALARAIPPGFNPAPFRCLKGVKFNYEQGSIEAASVEQLGGPFDLVSDLYSPFLYSSATDRVFRKYLELLKVGGRAYVRTIDVDKYSLDGSADKFAEYLKSVPNTKVTITGGIITIIKTGRTPKTPPPEFVLKDVTLEWGTPAAWSFLRQLKIPPRPKLSRLDC